MSRKKNQISPENVGQLFLRPDDDIPYRLIECATEPRAKMQKVSDLKEEISDNVSNFKDFVLLKPVTTRTRTKQEPKKERKTRADKGTSHKAQAEALRRSKQVPGGEGEDVVQPDKDLTAKVLKGTPLG